MSGRLTVLVQPRSSLWPRKGKGLPGKFAPVKCQPSSLSTVSSYQATPPRQGWWLFETSRVTPSSDRLGAMAKAFDPLSAPSSPHGSGHACADLAPATGVGGPNSGSHGVFATRGWDQVHTS